MARNKLSDLNNHLFAQLERLSEEELTGEKLQLEIERTKAITEVSKQVVDNAKTSLDAIKVMGEYGMKENIKGFLLTE